MKPAIKTYGTVSLERQRTMSGLEFVTGLANGELPLNTIAQTLGYDVVEAADGYDAMRIVEQHAGEIHLLLTDVIMPLMNGQELASRVKAIHPGVQILYMSGYTDDVLAFHGIASPDVAFIQKPFTPSELIELVAAMFGHSNSAD